MKSIGCVLGFHAYILVRADGQEIKHRCQKCGCELISDGPETKYEKIKERYLNATGNREGHKSLMPSEWEFFWIMSKIYEKDIRGI